MSRAQLEASLQAHWSFDDLAVYADDLLAAGEPRGELIALDLQPAPADRTWWVRRRAALVGWLGDALAEQAAPLVQHGFIHEWRAGVQPTALLAGPLGDVIRGFSVWGSARHVDFQLAELASRPRPWLARLAVTYWGKRTLGGADALIAATPNLDELVLGGYPVFKKLAHPRVRRLAVDERSVPNAKGERKPLAMRALVQLGLDPAATVRAYAPTTLRAGTELAEDAIREWRDRVAATPDCHTLSESDPDGLPMLGRLAAAGLIELEGPIARVATVSRPTAPWLGLAPAARQLSIDTGDTAVTIRSARAHLDALTGRIGAFMLSASARDALFDYVKVVHAQTLRAIEPDKRPALARVLVALVEQRGMMRDVYGMGAQAAWTELEQLAVALVDAPAGATVTWG